MPRFFITREPQDAIITLVGVDAHHVARVLRMKAGDEITLCNSAGLDYVCVIERITGDTVVCSVQNTHPSAGEPSVKTTLYMAMPKADKMELIIQKAVELGVVHIVPFLGSRSVSRPDEKGLLKKTERWRRIAAEAAGQCGRGIIPEVAETVSFAQAAEKAAKAQTALLFYECERETSLRTALTGKTLTTVSLMIGPEGGFALDEVVAAKAAGLLSVSLGPRILRCETAPLAALAAVMYESGNF